MRICLNMGYLKILNDSDFEKMNNAIEGEPTFDTMSDAFNSLFLKPNIVPICEKDRKDFDYEMAMTEEEYRQNFFETEGYYYTE